VWNKMATKEKVELLEQADHYLKQVDEL